MNSKKDQECAMCEVLIPSKISAPEKAEKRKAVLVKGLRRLLCTFMSWPYSSNPIQVKSLLAVKHVRKHFHELPTWKFTSVPTGEKNLTCVKNVAKRFRNLVIWTPTSALILEKTLRVSVMQQNVYESCWCENSSPHSFRGKTLRLSAMQ